eukprot:7376531-Prymnesium_polylepis.1
MQVACSHAPQSCTLKRWRSTQRRRGAWAHKVTALSVTPAANDSRTDIGQAARQLPSNPVANDRASEGESQTKSIFWDTSCSPERSAVQCEIRRLEGFDPGLKRPAAECTTGHRTPCSEAQAKLQLLIVRGARDRYLPSNINHGCANGHDMNVAPGVGTFHIFELYGQDGSLRWLQGRLRLRWRRRLCRTSPVLLDCPPTLLESPLDALGLRSIGATSASSPEAGSSVEKPFRA